jgi:uncharacterized protein (DUF58 family)
MGVMTYFDDFEIRDFTNLELLARQVVEGFIIGLHKSPFHGFSVEFAEHRLYNPGESTKNIDWKIYARSDKLFTKKFEEETNLRCQIVMDTSSSMFFPELHPEGRGINKIRFSALAAASLMYMLKKQRDAFGLSLFDEDVRLHTKCKSSTKHYQLLLANLEQLINDPVLNRKTSTATTLHEIADSIHKRSLVIIFSDMFEHRDDIDNILSALQHLKYNRHEVILFHVVDKARELEFEYDNRPYMFVDLESGEKVKLRSNEVKHLYRKQMEEMLAKIRMKCLQYKIDFIPTDIEAGYRSILQSYLVKRSKMGT